MTAEAIRVGWRRREPPLEVVGALVPAAGRTAFARALLDRAIDPLLRVCVDDEWLLALGPETALPWIDSAIWLGRESTLHTPTTVQPDVPADLVARHIVAGAPNATVLVATPQCVIASTRAATSPTPDVLHQLLRRWQLQ